MLLQAMADPRLSSLEPANFPGPTELLVHIILNGGPLQLTAFAKHLNMGLHQYSDQKVKHDNYLDATNQFIHFLFQ